jgi:hypothetical protein
LFDTYCPSGVPTGTSAMMATTSIVHRRSIKAIGDGRRR